MMKALSLRRETYLNDASDNSHIHCRWARGPRANGMVSENQHQHGGIDKSDTIKTQQLFAHVIKNGLFIASCTLRP